MKVDKERIADIRGVLVDRDSYGSVGGALSCGTVRDLCDDLEEARKNAAYEKDRGDLNYDSACKLGREAEALRVARFAAWQSSVEQECRANAANCKAQEERERANAAADRADHYCNSSDRANERAYRYEKALRALDCHQDTHHSDPYYARTIIAAALRPDAAKEEAKQEHRCGTCAARGINPGVLPCVYCYDRDDRPNWHSPTTAQPPPPADPRTCYERWAAAGYHVEWRNDGQIKGYVLKPNSPPPARSFVVLSTVADVDEWIRRQRR